MELTRDQILEVIRRQVEPLEYVHSMWEGGSAAFGTVDEHSDIDLQLDVEAGRTEGAFAAVETALHGLGELDYEWRVPEPTWHGYPQRFYHVAGAPEFLYIDLCVRPADKPVTLTEREHHGEPLIHFDKRDMVQSTALDRAAHAEKVRTRFSTLIAAFPMISSLCRKELLRGRHADAAGFYHTHTLRPLVELLRIRYCPLRHEFGLRYIDRDLPADVAQRLERLCFYASPDELAGRHAEAVAWFNAVAEQVDRDNVLQQP